jgi:glutamate-1-semialdehyde 2,1-aminomutase
VRNWRLATVVEAHELYRSKRPNSEAADARARGLMPGGNTRSVLHFDPFPFRVASAEGAHLTDVDGHTYVDLLGNYTAGLLGHSPAPIRRAVSAALETGFAMGATHTVEIEAAELIASRIPSIEQVRFTNSGTEANLMAIGLALHHTGRKRIIVFESGYHGGVLSFAHGGSPLNAPYGFVVLPFNDIGAVREAFAAAHAAGDDVACVLVEPMQGSGGCVVAAPGFLGGLRQLCDDGDALLIFDEVMTSRLAPGGAQERFGVLPDLTTLGKYFAGGLTFGAFGGPANIMRAFDPNQGGALSQAGTFNNNILSMSAVVATLSEILTADVLTAVNERGDRLRESLNEIFDSAAGLAFSVQGVGSLMAFHGTEPELELFFHAMLDAGWYMARRGFVALSIEITDQHVDDFLAAVSEWVVAA